MFNKKLKNRIEKLERKYVKDEKSGFVILREDSVAKILKIEFAPYYYSWTNKELGSTYIYFKKSEAPNWDYCIQDLKGERKYYKNDVEVKK